jgi:hypothetical protein
VVVVVVVAVAEVELQAAVVGVVGEAKATRLGIVSGQVPELPTFLEVPR